MDFGTNIINFSNTNTVAPYVHHDIIENNEAKLINDFYVFSKFNVDDPLEADFLFLGDTHGIEEISDSQGKILSSLAVTQKVHIVLENFALEEELTDEQRRIYLKKYKIPEELQENVSFSGWNHQCAIDLHDQYILDWEYPKMLELQNQITNNLAVIYQVIGSLAHVAENLQHLQYFLGEKHELEGFRDEITRNLEKPIASQEKIFEMELKRRESRSSAINNMAEKLKNNEIMGKIVFIQGWAHLKVTEDQKPHLPSLDSFYEELKLLKAVILLHLTRKRQINPSSAACLGGLFFASSSTRGGSGGEEPATCHTMARKASTVEEQWKKWPRMGQRTTHPLSNLLLLAQ